MTGKGVRVLADLLLRFFIGQQLGLMGIEVTEYRAPGSCRGDKARTSCAPLTIGCSASLSWARPRAACPRFGSSTSAVPPSSALVQPLPRAFQTDSSIHMDQWKGCKVDHTPSCHKSASNHPCGPSS